MDALVASRNAWRRRKAECNSVTICDLEGLAFSYAVLDDHPFHDLGGSSHSERDVNGPRCAFLRSDNDRGRTLGRWARVNSLQSQRQWKRRARVPEQLQLHFRLTTGRTRKTLEEVCWNSLDPIVLQF